MKAGQLDETGVHALQRALAVGAVLAGVPVVLFGLWSNFSYLYLMAGASLTAPLLCLRRPKHFTRACAIVGLVLIGWGVLGVFLGMFLFWPAAVLLLLAGFASPRRHPVTAWTMGGLGALVAAGVLTGAAVFVWSLVINPSLAKPHTYRAATDPGWFRDGVGDAQERLRGFGATEVYGNESDQGSFLEVRFPDDLPPARRADLKKEIGRLPGIRWVELCSVRKCG
ncbi:hypothetical protein [Streptomyces sp. TLI_146]|uniref:hypothetical protein n=1 Tax=Streptomyces sp. TLI_146 TaxID=1938858 RepID=UPI000CB3EF60|nr:hypothetical protein [Streptomyces sp. TLI_146]PKV89866.1 hypothetical protein BX283_7512 [Streptomyces sp. TLI_146]